MTSAMVLAAVSHLPLQSFSMHIPPPTPHLFKVKEIFLDILGCNIDFKYFLNIFK